MVAAVGMLAVHALPARLRCRFVRNLVAAHRPPWRRASGDCVRWNGRRWRRGCCPPGRPRRSPGCRSPTRGHPSPPTKRTALVRGRQVSRQGLNLTTRTRPLEEPRRVCRKQALRCGSASSPPRGRSDPPSLGRGGAPSSGSPTSMTAIGERLARLQAGMGTVLPGTLGRGQGLLSAGEERGRPTPAGRSACGVKLHWKVDPPPIAQH